MTFQLLHSTMVSMFSRQLPLLLALTTLLTLGGCGGSLPEGTTGTVKGRLTIDGAAAPEGTTVVLTHATETWAATGVVKADGYFSMRFRDGTKLMTGIYGVSVTPASAGSAGAVDVNNETEYEKMMMDGGNSEVETKPPFASRYLQPDTSGEEFEVAEGSNELNLDIKSE
ncbi:MAG: hypothetical protein KDA96_02745 [Planctomycetaceae bacterium]|nr:hypothetical protein [Planctomycetaceae bacterium]